MKLAIILALVSSQVFAGGETIQDWIIPPKGVVMKIRNNSMSYTYFWKGGTQCVQTMRFDNDGIITKFESKGVCRGEKIIDQTRASKALPSPDLRRYENPDLVMGRLSKGMGKE